MNNSVISISEQQRFSTNFIKNYNNENNLNNQSHYTPSFKGYGAYNKRSDLLSKLSETIITMIKYLQTKNKISYDALKALMEEIKLGRCDKSYIYKIHEILPHKMKLDSETHFIPPRKYYQPMREMMGEQIGTIPGYYKTTYFIVDKERGEKIAVKDMRLKDVIKSIKTALDNCSL